MQTHFFLTRTRMGHGEVAHKYVYITTTYTYQNVKISTRWPIPEFSDMYVTCFDAKVVGHGRRSDALLSTPCWA